MKESPLQIWQKQFFDELDGLRAFEPLFDCLPDIVFSVKDRAGRYVSISEACVERCHLNSRNEAIGKKAADLFPAHMAARYDAQDALVFATGNAVTDNLDLTLYADGSSGWCISHKVPLHNRQKKIIGLACISKDLPEPSREGLIDKRFADTVDYVQKNHMSGLRVDDLAKRAGLSSAQFERRMKKVFQLSPVQFVLKARISAAAQRLTQTQESIADIAFTVGFCDQSALSRQFKQVTGLSPRQYRQMLGDNSENA